VCRSCTPWASPARHSITTSPEAGDADDELLYQIRDTRTSNRFFVDNVIVDERGYGPILGAYASLSTPASAVSPTCTARSAIPPAHARPLDGLSEEQAKRVLRQLEELG
jgi:hypothetical protein